MRTWRWLWPPDAPRRRDLAWGLPKGLVERGERPEEAATREVREETGVIAEIREGLGDIGYWYVWDGERVQKRLSFFLMEAVGGDVADHDDEMEEVRWFPLAQAAKRARIAGNARSSTAPSEP